MYPKVPRSCQTGPAEDTGLWVWPAPSRADRFSVVKLCGVCNWVIGGEGGDALHGEVRVPARGGNTDVVPKMPGQNAFSPCSSCRAWSVLRTLLLRSAGQSPYLQGACLGFSSSCSVLLLPGSSFGFVFYRVSPCSSAPRHN